MEAENEKNLNLIKNAIDKHKKNEKFQQENESSSIINLSKNNDNNINNMKVNMNIAIETMNYEQAILICKKILFFTPNDANVYMTMSELFLKIFDLTSSVICLKKVLLITEKNEKDQKFNNTSNNFNHNNDFTKTSNSRNILKNKEEVVSNENQNFKNSSNICIKNTAKIRLNNCEFCRGLLKSQNSGLLETEIERLAKIRNEKMTLEDYYFLRAKTGICIGNIKNSKADVRKILTISSSTDSLILLSNLLFAENHTKLSEFLMWRALSLDPKNPKSLLFAKEKQRQMEINIQKAQNEILKKRVGTALLYVEKALRCFPGHPKALLIRSNIIRTKGKLRESIEDLNKARTEMNKNDVWMEYNNSNYNNKGNSDNYLHKVDEREEMEKLISESLSTIYNELALKYLESKEYPSALYYINEAIKSNPKDIYAHLNKGDYYLKQNDLLRAKEEYLVCYNIDNNFNPCLSRLSTIYYKLAILSYNKKDYKDALANLTYAASYYEYSDRIYILRARAHLKLDNVKEAYLDAVRAYMINPNNQDAIEIKKFLN